MDRVILDGQQVRVKNTALNAHALVRGAAGSGKSLILCERIARLLRETNYQDILVVTYNRFMAAWVRDLIQCTRNANITCETFNTWASRAVKHDYKNGAKDFEARACHSSLRYDAVLIDEAQDFKDEWFRGILHIIKPQTNSLFLVYDNAQSVYKSQHRRRSDWTWKKLDIIVSGRADILDICYRCSPEIVLFSWRFIVPFLNKERIPISRSNVGGVVEPKMVASRSSGVPVQVLQCIDYDVVAKEIQAALWIAPESSIAVMMHPDIWQYYDTQAIISASLKRLGIENHAPSESASRNGNVVTRPCVVVDSWNALKGVEFDAVILVGTDYVGRFIGNAEEFRHIAGLYAAMTRARDHLVVTYFEENEFVKRLKTLLAAHES